MSSAKPQNHRRRRWMTSQLPGTPKDLRNPPKHARGPLLRPAPPAWGGGSSSAQPGRGGGRQPRRLRWEHLAARRPAGLPEHSAQCPASPRAQPPRSPIAKVSSRPERKTWSFLLDSSSGDPRPPLITPLQQGQARASCGGPDRPMPCPRSARPFQRHSWVSQLGQDAPDVQGGLPTTLHIPSGPGQAPPKLIMLRGQPGGRWAQGAFGMALRLPTMKRLPAAARRAPTPGSCGLLGGLPSGPGSDPTRGSSPGGSATLCLPPACTLCRTEESRSVLGREMPGVGLLRGCSEATFPPSSPPKPPQNDF